MGAVLGTAIPIMLLTVIMAVVWTRRKSRQRALRMLAPFPFLSQTPHSVLPKQLFGRLALMLPTSKKNITGRLLIHNLINLIGRSPDNHFSTYSR
ncbi:hypothetical protein BT96DRAFT_168648 [Gymnopus androsaceus JB14]|uniref:Uncharacterized protein n=1 Tax=Gymnopus androsaceus JB14 TaxID=1447944 RepID=A0A6A4GBD9_9AGAR|nr:hypothetical protein BT96DRAFT_168648 [Gymnopus androsaceus JB14]